MATFSKPTIVPNWATTSGNVSVPSAGKRNDGWLSTEIPASDIENWNKRTTGEWIEWIDERFADGPGELTIGTIIVVAAANYAVGVDTDTFILDDGVNPAVTFVYDDDSSVVETATLRAIDHTGTESVSVMRTATESAINTAPTLDITALVVAGVVTLTNDATEDAGNIAIVETVVDAGFLVTGMSGGVDVDDTIEIIDPATATAIAVLSGFGVKFEPNKSVLIDGTGRYKHGDLDRDLHASRIIQTANVAYVPAVGDCLLSANSTIAVMSLDLDVGKSLESTTFHGFGGDTGAKNHRLMFVTVANGTPTQVWSISDTTSGAYTVTLDFLSELITAGRMYFFEVTSSPTSTTDRWAGVSIIYRED